MLLRSTTTINPTQIVTNILMIDNHHVGLLETHTTKSALCIINISQLQVDLLGVVVVVVILVVAVVVVVFDVVTVVVIEGHRLLLPRPLLRRSAPTTRVSSGLNADRSPLREQHHGDGCYDNSPERGPGQTWPS